MTTDETNRSFQSQQQPPSSGSDGSGGNNTTLITTVVASVVITALVVGGAVYLLQNQRVQQTNQEVKELQQQVAQLQEEKDREEKQEQQGDNRAEQAPSEAATSSVPADWKTYTNEEFGFEVKYPGEIHISESSVDDGVTLEHSVSWQKHKNPCDLKGTMPPLESVTDFSLTLRVVNTPLNATVRQEYPALSENLSESGFTEESGFIEKAEVEGLVGYKVMRGVEGCGSSIYFFPQNDRTLIADRAWIPYFGSYVSEQEIRDIPSVILPKKETRLFNQILSTFHFTE